MKGMHVTRSVSIFLIIAAVFIYGAMLPGEARAGDPPIFSQLFFGYLTAGAGFLMSCAGGCIMSDGGCIMPEYTSSDSEYIGAVTTFSGLAIATSLAASGVIYSIGQDDGCHGSLARTLIAGAVPAILGSAYDISYTIRKDDLMFLGNFFGLIVAPVAATIVYSLTDEEDNPDKGEVTVPLMSIRF